MDYKSINLYGPVNNLGYGVHFTNWVNKLVPMLEERGITPAVIPIGPIQSGNRGNNPALSPTWLDPRRFEPNAPSIALWHASNVSQFTGSKRILYTVFETSRLRGLESVNLSKVDGVIIPTHWHKEILSTHYGVESQIIHEGYDPEIFKPLPSVTRERVDADGFSLFSLGKFETRKGHRQLLTALSNVGKFPRPITIEARWHNPFIRNDQVYIDSELSLHGFNLVSKTEDVITYHCDTNVTIRLHLSSMSAHMLATLANTCHASIFPFAAEGWCLPLIESMACGLVPITNRYSGPTEYLPEKGYYLDSIEMVAADGMFFQGDQGTWKMPTAESIYREISKILEVDPVKLREQGLKIAEHVKDFTWEQAAHKSLPVIETLLSSEVTLH